MEIVRDVQVLLSMVAFVWAVVMYMQGGVKPRSIWAIVTFLRGAVFRSRRAPSANLEAHMVVGLAHSGGALTVRRPSKWQPLRRGLRRRVKSKGVTS